MGKEKHNGKIEATKISSQIMMQRKGLAIFLFLQNPKQYRNSKKVFEPKPTTGYEFEYTLAMISF